MKAFPFLRGSALEGIFLPSTKYTYLGYGFASIVFLGNVVINSKPYNNVAIKIINPERNKTNEAFHEVMLSSFVNERLLGKVGGKHFAQTIAFGATNRKDFFSKIFGVGIVEEEGKLKTRIEETSDFDNSVPKSQRAVWSKILQNSTYKTIYVIIQENAGTQTLAEYMETFRTPLDVHVIRSIAFQLMIAIHTASSSFGFVHSDIRWENIMIEPLPSNTNLQYALRQRHPNDKDEYFVIPDARVVVKLIDFGSSFLQKERTELMRSGTKPKGDMTDPYEWPHTLTFLFMPDEYGPTFSSDLFAIGIILLSLSCLNRSIGVLQDGFPQLQDTPRYEIRLNLLKRDFLQHRSDFKSLNSIPNVRWRETIPDKQLLQLLNTILEFDVQARMTCGGKLSEHPYGAANLIYHPFFSSFRAQNADKSREIMYVRNGNAPPLPYKLPFERPDTMIITQVRQYLLEEQNSQDRYAVLQVYGAFVRAMREHNTVTEETARILHENYLSLNWPENDGLRRVEGDIVNVYHSIPNYLMQHVINLHQRLTSKPNEFYESLRPNNTNVFDEDLSRILNTLDEEALKE